MSGVMLGRFGAAYAQHRAAEGRGYAGEDLLRLPYLRAGPFAQQWGVRARSFEALMTHVVRPMAAQRKRSLAFLDLGAGNGWLSYRVALEGHDAVALDIRSDAVDGLGAAVALIARVPGRIARVAASFDAIPLASASMDIAVFNASLHYALNLAACVIEAARVVRPGGRLVVLDSPFYHREADGYAMVAEKRARAGECFGERADALFGLPFVEFLTRERLANASTGLGLDWRRRRVRYPLWYEVRPLRARIRGERAPSRFDLWTSERP